MILSCCLYLSIAYNKNMNKEDLKKLAYIIKYSRDKKGLSQERLAELAGVSVATIGALERGVANLTLTNYYHIGKILEIDMGVLNNFQL